MNSVTSKQKQKSPCGICHKWVNSNHRALQCGNCHLWIHYRCNGLIFDEYQRLQLNMEVWFCKTCITDIFPFTSLDEFEFDTLVHSERPSDIELLPPLDIMSKISGLSNLDNSGIESNIPNPINSMYYYPSDFQKLNLSSSSTYFSLFHINLSSLDAHLHDLQTTLASLNFPFHIIGISETRENYSTGFKMNNNLDGFTLFSHCSFLSLVYFSLFLLKLILMSTNLFVFFFCSVLEQPLGLHVRGSLLSQLPYLLVAVQSEM